MIAIKLSKRESGLVKELLGSKEYKTIKYYADLLQVSERTIHNDLTKIAPVIAAENIEIEKKPGCGIKVRGEPKNKQRMLQMVSHPPLYNVNLTPYERQLEILKRLLIDEKSISYQKLTDDFFVSKSSITSDMKEVRHFFQKEGADLSSDNNGTFFHGTEVQRQCLLRNYNLSGYKYECKKETVELDEFIQYLFCMYSIDIVNASVQTLSILDSKLPAPVAEHYKVVLINTLVVMCVRIVKDRHHIKNQDELVVEKIKELETYFLTMEIVSGLEEQLQLHFFEEDTIYLNQNLIAIGLEAHTTNKKSNHEYAVMTKKAIEKMSRIIDIDLTADEKLTEGLQSHLIPMIYRIKNKITIKNPLLKEIRRQYSVMYSITWFVLADIEKELSIELSEDEVAFIMVHFQAAIERNARVKKVLIVCPTGVGTSGLVTNKIKRFLPSLDIYEVVSSDIATKSNLDEIDFVITTVPLEIENKPVIKVSPILTDADIRNVISHYTDVLLNEYKPDAASSTNKKNSELSGLIDKELIFVDQYWPDRKKTLDYMLMELIKRNYVSPAYGESVFTREEIESTALETGTAIPHGNPYDVKETKLVILVNKTKLDWGEQKVDVIVLLSISKEDIAKVENILKELFYILEDRKKVEQFFLGKTAAEIYSDLIEKV